MTEKEQRFKAKWEKTQAKGKRKYILTVSIFFTLFFPLFLFFVELVWPQNEAGFTLQDWIKNIIVGAVLGVFLSFNNWKTNQKRMENINNKNLKE